MAPVAELLSGDPFSEDLGKPGRVDGSSFFSVPSQCSRPHLFARSSQVSPLGLPTPCAPSHVSELCLFLWVLPFRRGGGGGEPVENGVGGAGAGPPVSGEAFCAGCRQGPSVWSCGEPVPRRIWITAPVTPSARQALHTCSDSLGILKALHLLPAAFSPFIWVRIFAEPSNKESRRENDGGEERESANIY